MNKNSNINNTVFFSDRTQQLLWYDFILYSHETDKKLTNQNVIKVWKLISD